MGFATLASVLHFAGRLSPSHCCPPIIVVQLHSSYPRPQIAAVIVIDIAAVGSGGGIINMAITKLPLPMLSPPLLLSPSSLMSLQRRCFVIVIFVMLFGGQSEELDQTTPPQTFRICRLLSWMGGANLAGVLHVAATHHHPIVFVPLLLSNHRHPIAILESPSLLSLTSLPSAAAAASLPLPLPLPLLLPLPSPPSPSLPSLSTLLPQRCFVIVVKMGGGQVSFLLILGIPT
jgi:hypothetical protein